jgi:hypothetical protein
MPKMLLHRYLTSIETTLIAESAHGILENRERSLQLERVATLDVPDTPEEKRSLQFFRQRTAKQWSGWCDSAFWNYLVLQVGDAQPALRHAVVSIGALHESYEVGGSRIGRSDNDGALRIFALQQCNKAISALLAEDVPLPVVLMSTVVFACQQMLHDHQTANRFVKSGVQMLEMVESDKKKTPSTFRLSTQDWPFIDNHIKPMLERFRAHFCSSNDPPHALKLVLESQSPALVSVPCIPCAFSSLHEARDCLDELLRWICSAIKKPIRKPAIGPDLKATVDDLSSQWASALDAVGGGQCTQEAFHKQVRTAMLLKAAHRTSLVIIQATGAETEVDFDDYVEDFGYIITMYEDILMGDPVSSPISKIKCGLDTGMIATLMFLQKRCRDPSIRRRAIALLSQIHRTEGDLDAGNSAALGNIMMAIEESGLGSVTSCKDIPECNRLRLLRISHFWKIRQRRVCLIRSPYDPELGATTMELWFPLVGAGKDVEHQGCHVRGGSDMLANRTTGRGYAEFLEEDSTSYYRMTATQFFFPIPQL